MKEKKKGKNNIDNNKRNKSNNKNKNNILYEIQSLKDKNAYENSFYYHFKNKLNKFQKKIQS